MDCVGCDKCRLWGKMQVTGLGTALKLLFSYDAASPVDPGAPHAVALSRSELVAFVNTLHRLSESLAAVDRFRTLWAHRGEPAPPPPHKAKRDADKATPAAAAAAAATPDVDDLPDDDADEPLNSAPAAAPSTHQRAFEPSGPLGVDADAQTQPNASPGAGVVGALWTRLVGLCEGGWSACVRVVAASATGLGRGRGDGEGAGGRTSDEL